MSHVASLCTHYAPMALYQHIVRTRDARLPNGEMRMLITPGIDDRLDRNRVGILSISTEWTYIANTNGWQIQVSGPLR
jgi:hypothetical protein